MNLLLIEDSETDALLFERIARKAWEDCNVLAVQRVSDALALLSDHNAKYHAIISDLSLPDSRDLFTIKTLVENAPSLPLLVLTGRGADFQAASISCGAQDYIIKTELTAAYLQKSVMLAIERKQLQLEQEQRFKRILEAQNEIVSSSMVLDQLFKTIVEGAQALVEGDGAAIELPEGNDLFCVAATGSIATLQSRRTSQQTSVSGEVFRSGASLCLEREQENAEQVSEDHSGSGGQSLLLVAMATQSRTVGVLQVARSKQHSSFTNAELHQLQVIGTLAAQVIAHAEAFSEKEKLLHELQEATEKLKVLRGLLPICSHCKKIRDQTGLWNHLEVYITAHSEANFTHSICPHCAQSFYKVPMRGVPSS